MTIGKRERSSGLGFTDLLFNTLVGFVFLFVISFLLIQPPEPVKKKIDSKAEVIITLTWQTGNYSDIDLWVKDPEGNIISFKGRTNGLMHLDRDDLGAANDTLTLADGTIVTSDVNREIATIRGWILGEWSVNVHFYAYRGAKQVTGQDNPEDVSPRGGNRPVPVTVELVQINPYKEHTTAKFDLTETGQEVTAFNFTVSETTTYSTSSDGTEPTKRYYIHKINNHPVPMVYKDGGLWQREGGESLPSAPSVGSNNYDEYNPALWNIDSLEPATTKLEGP